MKYTFCSNKILSQIVLLFQFWAILLPFSIVNQSYAAPEVVVGFDFENTTKRNAITTAPAFSAGAYTADFGTGANINTSLISANWPFTGLAWGWGASWYEPNLWDTWENWSWLKYWMIQFSTEEFKNLTLSSVQRSSNTGPRDFKVQYSTGWLAWSDVTWATVTVWNNFTTGVLTNISLPVTLENQSTVYLRWIMTSNISVNGWIVASTGTSRINDISVMWEFWDFIKPVITLTGSGVANIEAGISYNDTGATWTDNVDGTGSIVATGWPVVTTSTGSYTLNYNYTDVAGNVWTWATRTVNVVDTTLPVISLTGSGVVNLEIGDSYTDAGATYTDNLDGTGSLVATGWPVTTTSTGSFTLTYDYTDASGNIAAQVSRKVNVEDTTAPIITLNWSGAITLEAWNSYNDAGATWMDNLDGTGSLIATWWPIITTATGSYILSYDYTDVAGNIWTWATRIVDVVDTIPPIVTLNWTNPIQITQWATYFDAGASCTDNLDLLCTPITTGSVDTNIFWNTILTYTATDLSWNVQSIQRVVEVISAPPSWASSNQWGASGGYDRCGPLWDLSGDSYDGICDPVEIKTSEPMKENKLEDMKKSDITVKIPEDIQTIDTSTEISDEDLLFTESEPSSTKVWSYTKKIGDKKVEYTLENSFGSCNIISQLNNPYYPFTQNVFSDTQASDYGGIIDKFAMLQVVSGTKNWNFEPNRSISRAEFTKVLLLSHCYSYKWQDTSKLTFEDIPKESWQAKVISKASSLGIIDGMINSTWERIFKPNDTISKAEATKILLRMSMVQTELIWNTTYQDMKQDNIFTKYVHTGELLGIFDSTTNSYNFLPNSEVSRQEMLAMISRVIDLYK